MRGSFLRTKLLLAAIVAVFIAYTGGNGVEAGHTVKGQGCYPANEFPLGDGGPLSASSVGVGTATGEIEIPPFDTQDGASAIVSWVFSQRVTGNVGSEFDTGVGGAMSGSLAVTVAWTNPSIPATVFASDCIAEAQLDGNMIEAELEGTVVNFPLGKNAHKNGPTRAVATFHGLKENGEVTFFLNIELGTTCFEFLEVDTGPNEFEFTLSGTTATAVQTVSPGTGERGRAGLPAGFTPSSNPCRGVFF